MYTKFDLAKELKTNVFADPAVTSRFEKYIEVDFSDGHQDRLSQIFFDTGSGFNEEESIRVTIYSTASGNVCSKANIREQLKVHALRIDPVSDEQFFSVKAVRIVNGDKSVILSADEIPIYFEFVYISSSCIFRNGMLQMGCLSYRRRKTVIRSGAVQLFLGIISFSDGGGDINFRMKPRQIFILVL